MIAPIHSNFISLKELASLLVELDIASDFLKPLKTSHPFASGFDWLTKNSDILLKSQVLYTFGDEIRSRQFHEDSTASLMNGILFINNLCNFYAYRSMKGITEDDIISNGFSRKQVLLSLQEYTDIPTLQALINDATDFNDEFAPINTHKQDLDYAIKSFKAVTIEKLDLIKDKIELENQLISVKEYNQSLLDEIKSLKTPDHPKAINSILKTIGVLALKCDFDFHQPFSYYNNKIKPFAELNGIQPIPEKDTFCNLVIRAKNAL